MENKAKHSATCNTQNAGYEPRCHGSVASSRPTSRALHVTLFKNQMECHEERTVLIL